MADADLAVHAYDDPSRFLADVRPVLLAAEVEHALILGLLGGWVQRASAGHAGSHDADAPLLVRLTRGTETVGVAVRTPPRQLVLGTMTPEHAAGLATRLAASDRGPMRPEAATPGVPDGVAIDPASLRSLPGVLGPKDAAAAFARAWLDAGGARDAQLLRAQRLFEATDVLEVVGTPGRMRTARASDADLVAAWFDAFQDEALAGEPGLEARAPRSAADVAPWFEDPEVRGLALWQTHEGPAAMAGYVGPTPSGIRVSAVYTPPDKRRRGYATALVSALSRRLLERFERCMLFTDLANPTSNAIYARLGYRPVRDVDSWRFGS